jgi:hypothetical protein
MSMSMGSSPSSQLYQGDVLALAQSDNQRQLLLHLILKEGQADCRYVLDLMDKYPAALQHQDHRGNLPLHLECQHRCRSSIVSKCIEQYPQALAMPNVYRNLPLHGLLWNDSSSIEVALIMIEKCPAALEHRNLDNHLPLHVECMRRCRSCIISKCIELYPYALAINDDDGYMPLHRLLENESSTIPDTLKVIEKYPLALKFQANDGYFPLYLECKNQCRASIISKCIEVYPEALDHNAIRMVLNQIKEIEFSKYSSVLSIIFTARPMSLYEQIYFLDSDTRDDPRCRRQILDLLPHHVFTSAHVSDYRDLNWQPRAEMIMLLSQIKIQHALRRQQGISNRIMNINSPLDQPSSIA